MSVMRAKDGARVRPSARPSWDGGRWPQHADGSECCSDCLCGADLPPDDPSVVVAGIAFPAWVKAELQRRRGKPARGAA